MRFCALTTGSSGNCYYIENEKEALLIDAGISAKKILEKFESTGINSEKVKAVLLTHEHTDHKIGADVLARRLNIPVIGTKGTLKKSVYNKKTLTKEISNDEEFNIGGFRIRAIPKSHTAADPISFLIENEKKKVSFITDLGRVCKETSDAISESDFIFLESNHDVKMLEEGPYLPFHKKWVLSDKGHLSNLQASLAILEHAKQNLSGVTLTHLSRVNNTSLLAEKTFKNIMKERSHFNPGVFVSEKDVATQMFGF